jgi:hypothetical protein
MKKLVGTALLASLLVFPYAMPASADTGAVFRNVVLLGAAAAAALGITNYNHKKHLKVEEDEETDRRQASYKAYYYRTTGNYPTQEQIHQWYVKTYGTQAAD